MLSNNINHFEKAFHQEQTEENRKGGRFPTANVWSGLGDVLDLSSTGALIIKRRFLRVPSDEAFVVEIRYEEISVVVNAQLVRRFKKKGIGHLVAIEFLDVTEEQCEAVREIVRNSRSWRLFDFSESDAA